MKVVFQHPPVQSSKNPFNDFAPSNINHYPKGNGIYIYGLRLEFQNNVYLERKFVPLAVGEGNLINRLYKNHYLSLKTNGNNCKELFNWGGVKNLNDIKSIYLDMMNYIPSKVKHNAKLDNLIWWNRDEFFNIKLGNLNIKSSYISDSGQMSSIGNFGDLDTIYYLNSNLMKALRMKFNILLTKELFYKNFYFIYIKDDQIQDSFETNYCKNPGKRKSLERTIKETLYKIKIYTTADSRKGKYIRNLEIDLTKIQNDLINVGGHSYNYTNLIIKS